MCHNGEYHKQNGKNQCNFKFQRVTAIFFFSFFARHRNRLTLPMQIPGHARRNEGHNKQVWINFRKNRLTEYSY